MRKGGYSVLNLSGIDFVSEGSAVTESVKKGTFSALKNGGKAILVSGLTINGSVTRDTFVPVNTESATIIDLIHQTLQNSWRLTINSNDTVTLTPLL